MQYLGLGAEIAASLAIPLLLGFWLDNYFQTSPGFTIAGIFLGIVLLFLTFMRIYRSMFNDKNEK